MGHGRHLGFMQIRHDTKITAKLLLMANHHLYIGIIHKFPLYEKKIPPPGEPRGGGGIGSLLKKLKLIPTTMAGRKKNPTMKTNANKYLPLLAASEQNKFHHT
jgi:hypothetical protein